MPGILWVTAGPCTSGRSWWRCCCSPSAACFRSTRAGTSCVREIRKVSGTRTLWQFFRTSRNSELIVVLGEDVAALVGLVFALIAVVVAFVSGNPVYDAIGS